MKILRYALPLILLGTSISLADGQTHAVDRGSLLVGGSGSFSSSGRDGADDRDTRLVLQPHVQYFVAPGLALGGQIVLFHFADGDQSSTTVGIGPEISYYFGAASARTVYPFLSAGVQLYEGDTDSFGFGGSAGILYMLAEAVGLETALFYRELDPEGDFGGGTDEFGVSLGVSAFIF